MSSNNSVEKMNINMSNPTSFTDKQINVIESKSFNNNDTYRGNGMENSLPPPQPRLNISPMDDLLINKTSNRPVSPTFQRSMFETMSASSASSDSGSMADSEANHRNASGGGGGGGGGFFSNLSGRNGNVQKQNGQNMNSNTNYENDDDNTEEEYEEDQDGDEYDDEDGDGGDGNMEDANTYHPPPQRNGGGGGGGGGGGFQQRQAPNMTGNGSAFQSNNYYDAEKTAEMVLNRKRELLYQFERLEKKGIMVPRKFSLSDNLDDMEATFEKIKKEREVDGSVKFQRKMLTAFCSGVEFLNTQFDPFHVKLDGWAESIHENINDYDDIFEELHEKYKGKAKVPPEMRLVFALASSGFMFHMTNSLFKNTLPGLDQVLKQNPDLMRQFAGATANMMSQNDNTGMASMFSNMFSGGGMSGGKPSGGSPVNMQPPSRPQMSNPSQPQGTRMKGPSHMAELFDDMDNNRVEEMSTITTSEISELTEADSSYSGVIMRKKKSGKRAMAI